MFLSISLIFVGSLIQFGCSRTMFDNTFIELRKKPYFVDKTPLIYEFLQHKYVFISAPSKFGKTANLDMLHLFLANHRSKSNIENHFIWTKIWDDKEFVDKHIGQYPVVYFSFKIRGFSSDYENTLRSFKVSMYNAFTDHLYLLESEKLSEEEIRLVKDYTDLTKIKLMDTPTFANGLAFLAKALYKHHGKQVILLSDEFGRGITEGILQDHVDLDSVIELYSSFLNSTFTNESIISHALLAAESSLYGLNSPGLSLLQHVNFMQKVEFSRFFGFTYDELDILIPKYNVSQKDKSDILRWFGGYSSYDGLFKVCNPFSVVQYLSHKNTLMVYWPGSDIIAGLIRRMAEVDSLNKVILELVMRKPVSMSVETKDVDLDFLRRKVCELPQYCENYFLRVLLETGYLTYAETQGGSGNISLVLPNEEIRSAIVAFSVNTS